MKYIKSALKLFFQKENFIYFLKISSPLLVFIALQGLIEEKNSQMLLIILMVILGIWYQAAILESIIRVKNGEKLEFKDTYKKAWSFAFRLFAVSLVVGLIVFGGLLLLIIPGLIFAVWYSFSQFGVATKNLGVRASLKESKSLVSGKFWRVFGMVSLFLLFNIISQIVFSLIPYNLGGLFSTIFSALFLLPCYLFYLDLEKEKGQTSDNN